LGGKGGTRDAGEAHDLHAELEDEFLHVLGTFALEQLDGCLELQRGADAVAERLVHVGDEGDAAALERAADPGHGAGELLRLLQILDEGAVAPLYVDDETFAALGELL